MKTNHFITAILLIFSCVLSAQQRTIEGTITYGQAPIKGIKVSVQGTKATAFTDDKGFYKIELPNPESTIIISGEGIISQYVTLKKKISKLDFKVELSDQDEAIAAGLINPSTSNSQATITINKNGNDLLDIGKMIEGRLPGVSYENGIVYIRGEACEYYSIDGSRIENLSALNPDDIADIKIVKDGTASIYGGKARNGAVVITTKGQKK